MRFFLKPLNSMDKTLHKKLIEKHLYQHASNQMYCNRDHIPADDLSLLREAANELLQPRPQAIAHILKMSRAL
jgi:hypothetical protein